MTIAAVKIVSKALAIKAMVIVLLVKLATGEISVKVIAYQAVMSAIMEPNVKPVK